MNMRMGSSSLPPGGSSGEDVGSSAGVVGNGTRSDVLGVEGGLRATSASCAGVAGSVTDTMEPSWLERRKSFATYASEVTYGCGTLWKDPGHRGLRNRRSELASDIRHLYSWLAQQGGTKVVGMYQDSTRSATSPRSAMAPMRLAFLLLDAQNGEPALIGTAGEERELNMSPPRRTVVVDCCGTPRRERWGWGHASGGGEAGPSESEQAADDTQALAR